MWSPGGEEPRIARCPHAAGCCQHFVCSVGRYSNPVRRDVENADCAVSHCTHPTHGSALIRNGVLMRKWRMGSKGRRWGAGEETVKRWVAMVVTF